MVVTSGGVGKDLEQIQTLVLLKDLPWISPAHLCSLRGPQDAV